MARTARPSPVDQDPLLNYPVSIATAKLSERILLGKALIQSTASPGISNEAALENIRAKFNIWTEYNEELLRSLFTHPERVLLKYIGGPSMGFFAGAPDPLHVRAKELGERIQTRIHRLESVIERLELFPQSPHATAPAAVGPVVGTRRVFIVHGHDDAARLALARFLEATKTNFEIQILNEATNQGRTIIEKLEHEATSATYAVVLLTADDEGGPRTNGERRPRARQNVILELGYFIGKLNRKSVAILYEEGVELPSDVQGVAYILLDDHDGWKLKLGKELRASGHQLDLAKAP
jgi:predicted nucleotide-binding protein